MSIRTPGNFPTKATSPLCGSVITTLQENPRDCNTLNCACRPSPSEVSLRSGRYDINVSSRGVHIDTKNLTCIELVEVVAEWKGINPMVKVYCDNQEAGNFTNDPYVGSTPTLANRRNIDLNLQIRSRLKQARAKIEAFHVKSHQDDDTPEEELSRESQMNCTCDRLAKQLVDSLGRSTGYETHG